MCERDTSKNVRTSRAGTTPLLILLVLAVFAPIGTSRCTSVEIPAHNMLEIPYHSQGTPYYCGPASIQMVLDFLSGSIVSQDTLAGELRTDPVAGVTYTNFMQAPLNKRGYQSTQETDSTLDELRQRNFEGDAIVLLIWFDTHYAYGHYIVMTGYNETGIFVNDPWPSNWGQPSDRSTGRNAFISYVLLAELWEFSERWALFVPNITTVTIVVQDLFGISVGGVQVRVSSPNGDLQEQVTDSAGVASFTSVPRGNFSVYVTSWGITTELEGNTALSRGITVTVLVSAYTVFAVVAVAGLFLLMAHRAKREEPSVGDQPPIPPATVGMFRFRYSY